METLTPEQVRHIAKLARLTLNDAEVAQYATELTSVFKYVEMLGEVNTEGITPTAQVSGQGSSLRADEVYAEPLATPDALLDTSPLPIEEHQIETPSAHGSASSPQVGSTDLRQGSGRQASSPQVDSTTNPSA